MHVDRLHRAHRNHKEYAQQTQSLGDLTPICRYTRHSVPVTEV
jgi:hypothetical protein